MVPYYLQPTIGGNSDVRGFPRYRYHDNHSVLFSVEHRWHGFTGLDTALFIDAGKVIAHKAEVDLSNLKVSVGFGFRVRVADAVVMRMEIAAGREGDPHDVDVQRHLQGEVVVVGIVAMFGGRARVRARGPGIGSDAEEPQTRPQVLP